MLYYCEQKASQSDSLSRLFNINDVKTLKRSMSYNSAGVDRSLNEMSLYNSQQQLEEFNWLFFDRLIILFNFDYFELLYG